MKNKNLTYLIYAIAILLFVVIGSIILEFCNFWIGLGCLIETLIWAHYWAFQYIDERNCYTFKNPIRGIKKGKKTHRLNKKMK